MAPQIQRFFLLMQCATDDTQRLQRCGIGRVERMAELQQHKGIVETFILYGLFGGIPIIGELLLTLNGLRVYSPQGQRKKDNGQ